VNAPLPSSDAPPAAVAPVPMMNLRRFIVFEPPVKTHWRNRTAVTHQGELTRFILLAKL